MKTSVKIILCSGILIHYLLLFIINVDTTLDCVVNNKGILLVEMEKSTYQPVKKKIDVILGRDKYNFNDYINYYLAYTGTETGYGFFAPNVPTSYKLVFEYTLKDHSKVTMIPQISSHEIGLRLCNYYETIGKTNVEILRNALIKFMLQEQMKGLNNVVSAKAIFGLVLTPALKNYSQSNQTAYQFLYAYEYNIQSK
ncbi:hypothetical protein [Pedobacter punctiformis]|uniref:Uncharacterized protein n=1 Tax=Pedobacter punctiformis TaxID=3004097 RepID=A0ABT4LC35_9SPHI|nr:hypothetical protein [Pedobacter sp. HCMS5-2]MCZ4244349.1 hypothetical protein [Pedobacter sp. HCMS5-2]